MDDDEVEWSETCYSFKDLVKKFTLPQLVMVDEGYMLNETESLSSGQLITVQSHDNVTQFKGKDAEGKAITIPIKCPFKVKLVDKNEGNIFKGVRELCLSTERPKYVEVTSSKTKKDLGLVKTGDRLKILLTERGPDGPMYLHFRNQKGKHLRLPADYGCEFRSCAENDNEHSIVDLIGRELPKFIKFVDSRAIGDSIGVIELNDCVSEDLVFSSTKHLGQLFVTAFPITLDVKVRTIKDTPSAKRFSAMVHDSVNHKIDIDRFREFIARDKDGGENGYVYFTPMEVVKESNRSIAETKTKNEESMPGIEANESAGKIVNEYEQPINSLNSTDSPKRKSVGFLSKVRLKFRGNKSTNRKSQEMRPEIVIVDRQNGASSDGGDSGIYEEIPADTYVSMDVIDGARRVLGTPKKTPVRKRSLSRAQSSGVPPPLPGNHPLERRNTYNPKSKNAVQLKRTSSLMDKSREKESFKMFYENMKKSELQILNCDLEGVESMLRELNLQKYAKKFRDNQVDGKLLIDLDEAVFKDIGLSPFEARKLRKYVFGWRPDATQRTNYNTPISSDNNEALQWDETEVANHVTSLGLGEFSAFCKKNQVNGDLLWDMVLDEEMIYSLLTGKERRLNAVKLKNYVTEGWRPKISKKRANTVNYGTIEKKSKTKDDDSKRKSSPASVQTTAKISNESPLRCPASPASPVTEDLSSTSFGRSDSKGKSRLNFKVSYPKGSPYSKSTTGAKVEEAGAKKPVEPSRVSTSQQQEPMDWEPANVVTKAKVSAEGKARQSNSTRKSPGLTSSKSVANKRRNTTISEDKNTQEKKANEAGEISKKPGYPMEVRPNRTFSLREKRALKTAAEKSGGKDDVKVAKIRREGNDQAKSVTGGFSSHSVRKVSAGKIGASSIKDKDAKGVVAKTDKTKKVERESVSKESNEVQLETQSPTIANLRKNYERNNDSSFKESDKLQRAKKNDFRMAIKRKDSGGIAGNKDEGPTRPATAVAQLKKHFDTKLIL